MSEATQSPELTPPPPNRGILVRVESFGYLLWSHERRAYYRPSNAAATEAIQHCIDAHESKDPLQLQSIPLALHEQLRDLGSGHGLEVLRYDGQDRLGAPLEAYFDYTWLCNLAKHKCGLDSFCYSAEVLGPTTLKPERVNEIIAELREWGVMRLHLAGGEPTIHKRFLENYLASAHHYGLWTSVNTNGTLVDDAVMDIVLANGLKSMSFSIDGSTEEAFAKVRGEGLWSKAIEGLQLAIRRKREAGSAMEICVKPTFPPDVPREFFEEFVEFAVDIGADVLKFANPERCLRHEPRYYETTIDQHYKNIEIISELIERNQDRIDITNIANPMAGCGDIGLPGMEGCIGGQELLAINPDGTITPCLIHPRKLGTLEPGGTGLRDFWATSQELRKFWRELQRPSACNGCDIHSMCRSGSVTRRVVQTSIPVGPDIPGEFSNVKDPLCPRDYLARNSDKQLPPQKSRNRDFPDFAEVVVKHAL